MRLYPLIKLLRQALAVLLSQRGTETGLGGPARRRKPVKILQRVLAAGGYVGGGGL